MGNPIENRHYRRPEDLRYIPEYQVFRAAISIVRAIRLSQYSCKYSKQFLKTLISVDTDQQVITGFIASNRRVHDIRHATKLLRQCHKN